MAPMPPAMFMHLILSAMVITVTVILHAVGLALLVRMLRNWTHEANGLHHSGLTLYSLGLTVMVVMALFALHGIEIWLYAFFFLAIGAINNLETAVYFSTISYTTIGYTDVYIAPHWRLQAAIEGINGLLLMGWSTAFFVTMAPRLGR